MPKLDHIALEVSDMDVSIIFYTTNLGFTLTSRAINEQEQEEYCFLDSQGTRLEPISDLKKDYHNKIEIEKPYCPRICFVTDDMDSTLRELQEKNIEIVRGPLEIEGEERWVYFADPDGNVLEYIQWYK
jgi:catechol 2,3-dioxygenase-like lactoylglutathione lyase family enzyme